MRMGKLWIGGPRSISRRITTWFIVIVIPLVLLLYAVFHLAEQAVSQKMEEINSIQVEQTASRIRDLFHQFFISTNLFINDKRFIAALENPDPIDIGKLYAYRDSLEMLKYSFFLNKKYAIVIRDEAGNVYESDSLRTGIPKGQLGSHVFNAQRIKDWDIFDSAYWSSLDLPAKEGTQSFIVFNRWIFNPDTSTPKGLVSLVLPITYLTEILLTDESTASTYDIVDENQIVIFSTDGERIGTKASLTQGNEAVATMLTPSQWTLYHWKEKDLGAQQLDVLRYSFFGAILVFLLLFITLSAFVLREIRNTIIQIKSLSNQLMIQSDTLAIPQISDYRIAELSQNLYRLVHNLNVSKKNYEQSQEEKRRLELYVLQQQINPHFLLNTLNTIRWLADKTGQNKISSLILALSYLLRQQLYYEDTLWTVRDEQQYLTHYIEIQRTRFGENYHVEIRLDEELYDRPILKMLLQPFVENCFEHAFSGKDSGTIRITGQYLEHGMLFKVVDDGIGMSEYNRSSGGKGRIGIDNVRSRIQLHYGLLANFEAAWTNKVWK